MAIGGAGTRENLWLESHDMQLWNADVKDIGGDLEGVRHRSILLARHVLPHEPLLRTRLRAITVYDFDVEDIIHETYSVRSSSR